MLYTSNIKQVLIPPDLEVENLRGVSKKLFSPLLLEGKTMGTYWKLNILVEELHDGISEELGRIVSKCFNLVIDQMSHWKADSVLSEINRSQPHTPHLIPRSFFHVLEAALEVAKLTGGTYDPTVGLCVSLSGFGPSGKLFSDESDGIVARDWSSITLDRERQTLSHQGLIYLDLSSIAKGYAIDLACSKLEKAGYIHYLVEIGGEMRGAGCKVNGEPWWAEISTDAARLEHGRTLVAMSGISLATSGISVKNRVESGGLKHHLIDTRVNESISSDLITVSVITESCMLADAWATALFTLGFESGLKMADELEIAAIFMDKERIYMSQSCKPFLVE